MNDFTEGPITKHLLRFAVPMLIGNVFQQLYSMADAVVVGRYVSGNALAAVGVAMNVLNFLVAALVGLTTGASVLISQLYGAKQHDRLRRAVATSVVFLAALSVLAAAVGVLWSPAIMGLLDAAPEIAGDAALYLRLLMGGMIFPIFYNMYTAYLRALGDSRGPLFILICCTVLNTGLDLLFVVAFGMGVAGVAVATLIAQCVSALLCFLYARQKAPLLHIRRLVFDVPLFRSILKYGTPAAVQLSLVSLASLTITRLINAFGPSAMAGITAASKIDQMAIMPVSTVSMALSTFAGQNIGAGREERARRGLHSAVLLMTALALGISGLLIPFAPKLVALFLNQSEAGSAEILSVGTDYLAVIVAFYFLFALLFAFNGFFRGVGDAVIAMVFPVASLTVRSAAAHMLVGFAGMGPEALAWSIPIGWGATALVSFWYYRKRLWAGKTAVGKRA